MNRDAEVVGKCDEPFVVPAPHFDGGSRGATPGVRREEVDVTEPRGSRAEALRM